jgi:acetyl esterase
MLTRMPLDPDLAGLIALIEAGTPMSQQTAEQARSSFRTLTVDFRRPESVVHVGAVEDSTVGGAEATSPLGSTGPTVRARSRPSRCSTAAAS